MLAKVAGPDQLAAKKMRPGHCTQKLHPGCPGLTFLRTAQLYTALPKLATPAGNTFALVHLRQKRLAQANYMFQCTRENEKKSTCITLFLNTQSN